tara:strand:- start:15 stop:185 length:171 start_codon:yes stop_codon:yes gene_type:complete
MILLKEKKILVHQYLAPIKPENNGKLKKTTEQQKKTPQNTEQQKKLKKKNKKTQNS